MSCNLNSVRLSRHAQRGVGLIEVLIAVLILSVGMLGLVSLQLWTIRNNQSSMERSMAVVQTYSIVDAMRAERNIAMAGGFNLGIDAPKPTTTTFAGVSLATWRTNITAALGDGATGSVDCNGALCTIAVRWNEDRAATGDAKRLQIDTQVQL